MCYNRIMREGKVLSRNTPQRNLVLKLMENNFSHPTADEIYEKARKADPHISRGTVYRNLNLLAEAGFIAKIMVPSGADHFDSTLSLHYHFHCDKCDKLYDVPSDCCPKLDAAIQKMKNQGFSVESHSLIFNGICPECAENEGQFQKK